MSEKINVRILVDENFPDVQEWYKHQKNKTMSFIKLVKEEISRQEGIKDKIFDN